MNRNPITRMVRSLKSRNFRLYFGGQSVSLVGTWMTRMAAIWLVYRLTGSAFMLGVIGFANQVPVFVLSPIAGLLIDRSNRHKILVVTQTLAMFQSFALAFLSLTGWITVWHVVALCLLQGLIDAFDIPARQALVADLIDRSEDLGNAIALNSTMVNAARLIGPAVAGALIGFMGEGSCFLLDALSYVPVIWALCAMRIKPKKKRLHEISLFTDFKGGLKYIWGSVPIRSILLLLGLVSFMATPYRTLLPVMTREVLNGGPRILGILMASSALGAIAAALYLASRRNVLGLGRITAWSAMALGLTLIVFAWSRALWLSVLIVGASGFAMIVCVAASNTILQTIVDEGKRAQVMSFYTMAFMGMSSFGNLWAGSLASKIDAPGALVCGGICCLLGAAAFLRHLPELRKILRPLYAKMGIIPEPALPVDR